MADIARIGFAADTSGLKQAKNDLNALVPAAQKAEAAAEGAAAGLNAVEAAAQGVSATTAAATKVINAGAGVTAKAATEYDKLARILKIAQTTQASMGSGGSNDNKTFADANAHVIAYRNSLNDANAHVIAYRTNLSKATPEIDKSAKATAGLSWQAKNLSFQLVDITQGLASGVPLFQIFAQQAGQVGQALASAQPGQNLFKEIFKAIASILTPMRLLVLGVTGLAVAFVFLGKSVLTSFKAMDDFAKSIDTPLAKLYQLQQAAAFKGVSKDAFMGNMEQFAKSVYDAQRNMGELKGLMIANGMSAKTLEQYLNNVADLVSRTNNEMQKRAIIEAAGMTYTKEWAKFLSQGRAGIAAALAETQKLNPEIAGLIEKQRQFDELWNKTTTQIKEGFKSAIIDAISWVDKLSKATTFGISAALAGVAAALAPFSLIATTLLAVAAAITAGIAALKGSGGGTPGATRVIVNGGTTVGGPEKGGAQPKTREELMKANSDAQARISILGDLATVSQQVALKQLEINAANLNGVGPSDTMTEAILNNVRAQAEMNKVNQQAQIGIFDMSLAQQAANNTLQSWIDKGLVNKDNVQQMAAAQEVLKRNIEQTSEAAQVAASKYPMFTQAMLDAGNMSKQLDQTLTTSFNGLVSPIQDTINGVTSLKDGFKNAGQVIVKAIQEMIIKMLILKPLMSMFGGFGSGILGLFGGGSGGGTGFSLTGTGGLFAKGGVFSNSIVTKPTLFANGGKLAGMGEAGPEAVMPLTRGPGGSLGVQMYGANNNGSGAGVQINDNSTYVIGGNVTQDDIAKLRAENDRKLRETEKRQLSNIADARRRGAKV